jgi:hypothetical protein
MLLPMYTTPQREHPFAVFEVCQTEKNVLFPSLVDLFQRCLEVSLISSILWAFLLLEERRCLPHCQRKTSHAIWLAGEEGFAADHAPS